MVNGLLVCPRVQTDGARRRRYLVSVLDVDPLAAVYISVPVVAA